MISRKEHNTIRELICNRVTLNNTYNEDIIHAYECTNFVVQL